MSKKLMTGLLALVAFAAVALPATASASPVLTENGSAVAVGTKITGTNVGTLLMKDAAGNVLTECSTATMTGTLNKNNGTEVEGTIETALFGGTGATKAGEPEPECTGSFGNVTVTTTVGNGVPWCLTAKNTYAANEFQIRGNSCANAARSITFLLASTTVGECKYERTTTTGPIHGTYTTAPEDLKGTVSGGANAKFVGESTNSFLCPAEGYLFMTFTLETDKTTAEPLSMS